MQMVSRCAVGALAADFFSTNKLLPNGQPFEVGVVRVSYLQGKITAC